MSCLPAIWTGAQETDDYRPFAQESKVWELQVGIIQENIYGNYIGGDTLINGEIWKKVYNYLAFQCPLNFEYYAAIREVEKKVYAIAKGSNRPRLLYDFSLKEGNMVKCGIEGNAFGCLLDNGEKSDSLLGFPFETYLMVERIDTIIAHGVKCRRFTLSLMDAYKGYFLNGWKAVMGNVIWIEGVGSGAGPFTPWMPFPPEGCILSSCEVDGKLIYSDSDLFDAEIVNSVESIHTNEQRGSAPFDLTGRHIPAPPSKGVYIEDGRKKVGR